MMKPSHDERMLAIDQVVKAMIDDLCKLGSSYNWRVVQVSLRPDLHGGYVTLEATGWPRLTVQTVVNFQVRISADGD